MTPIYQLSNQIGEGYDNSWWFHHVSQLPGADVWTAPSNCYRQIAARLTSPWAPGSHIAIFGIASTEPHQIDLPSGKLT